MRYIKRYENTDNHYYNDYKVGDKVIVTYAYKQATTKFKNGDLCTVTNIGPANTLSNEYIIIKNENGDEEEIRTNRIILVDELEGNKYNL